MSHENEVQDMNPIIYGTQPQDGNNVAIHLRDMTRRTKRELGRTRSARQASLVIRLMVFSEGVAYRGDIGGARGLEGIA